MILTTGYPYWFCVTIKLPERIDEMRKKTVKRRIFISNALMVLVTLIIFLLINVAVIKVYSESIEQQLKNSAEKIVDADGLEDLLEDFTIHRNDFVLLFFADGIFCIMVLVLVSQLFTGNLVKHIMKPLAVLSDGAERIRNNDLTQEIQYVGNVEFENVCIAFNEMQKHILTEQEKNQRYEKSRTEMISGISHDLRTPLTAVRGTIKGLLDGIASTRRQQEKFLEAAYRRTGDMDALLNQLFYLSKLETGNMPIFLQTIELSAFVVNYVKTKQILLENESVEIIANTNGITANVSADPEQLQRVFDNLLENSMKYAETIPRKIKLTLTRKNEGFCICFMDNGKGVPEEKLPFLFEEFYRADESRNRKEGNGLGLYIVNYLIDSMGGSVWAENKDGFAVYMMLPSEDKGERNGR